MELPNHAIDKPVFLCFLGAHKVVAFGIVLDGLKWLTGVLRENFV